MKISAVKPLPGVGRIKNYLFVKVETTRGFRSREAGLSWREMAVPEGSLY